MIFLFDIGFLPIRIWDVLDILIVGYLLYQLYKLLRGNIAFNIFIGVLMLYVIGWLVTELKMDMLSAILGTVMNVGVIVIIIIFQPEVRRFLLFLGDSTIKGRFKFVDRFINRNFQNGEQDITFINTLKAAIKRMSRQKTGALIVLRRNLFLEGIITAGAPLDAIISEPLIESIFSKESPLHDGAVIINNNKIEMASCVLPVSESSRLPKSVGLRHRAAVGITERAGVAVFVVSEETGSISFAFGGKLERKLSDERLGVLLEDHWV
ncbi:MAG: diadenylate cyclase CdaA [Saprospiraceae bacterium]|nr:diadenylate cyclase CdaA [Saprospiraceae bacterium]MCB9326013.1 TIGR00159 family protein [Lewinellaceae bacterium]